MRPKTLGLIFVGFIIGALIILAMNYVLATLGAPDGAFFVSILILLLATALIVLWIQRRNRRNLSRTSSNRCESVTVVFGEGRAGEWRDSGRRTFDVDCTVFTPPGVKEKSQFGVQAILHEVGLESEAAAQARMLDEEAIACGQAPLTAPVSEGDVIELRLIADGVGVPHPVQQVVWRGRTTPVVFIAKLPPDGEDYATFGTIELYLKDVPIGRVVFRLPERSQKPDESAEAARLTRYSSAFLSYASPDRLHVLRHHQLMKSLGIDVFQDCLSITPGQRWERRLFEEVENCDLFLLYWSSAAKRSKWVIKEAEHALAVQEKFGEARPTIIPVILEGPPPVPPPESLSRIHMNDSLRYIIYVHEQDS